MYDPDALSTNWSPAPGERELPQDDRAPRGEARHLDSPRVTSRQNISPPSARPAHEAHGRSRPLARPAARRAAPARHDPVTRPARAPAPGTTGPRSDRIADRRWMMGQLMVSGSIGGTTALALGLLGIPYFCVPAFLATLGEMVPYAGPIV